MNIVFYKNESDRKKLTKNITVIADVTGIHLKEPVNVLEPSITVKADSIGKDWPTVNYAYIPLFQRYYFCKYPATLSSGLLEFNLTVDPLMSYRAGLLNTSFEIARSESINSPYYIDNQKALLNRRMVSTMEVGNITQDASGKKYTITVAGGV